jgi:hypothetical protein
LPETFPAGILNNSSSTIFVAQAAVEPDAVEELLKLLPWADWTMGAGRENRSQ